ncbi:MAG TPA: F0F1 ATP synthase subunit B [Candidatus Binataceae bacterium]|jgi:F-type H+-transporting ATPase subunit b
MGWWTLAFQAINFLVLVWLLAHFLYRPVMEIMERRKGEVDRAYAEAAAAKAAADSVRAEYEALRTDAAKAATDMLDEAKEAALRERNAMVDQARADAGNIAAAARERIGRERDAAERELRERIARLGVEVARVLLGQSVSGDGATPMLADRALRMLEEMPSADRERLASDLGANSALQIACAAPLPPQDADLCRKRIAAALGREVAIDFTQDPALIAGVELRLPHSVLNCSWKESLAQALKVLLDSDGDAARKS